jgi:hypothetical protein
MTCARSSATANGGNETGPFPVKRRACLLIFGFALEPCLCSSVLAFPKFYNPPVERVFLVVIEGVCFGKGEATGAIIRAALSQYCRAVSQSAEQLLYSRPTFYTP